MIPHLTTATALTADTTGDTDYDDESFSDVNSTVKNEARGSFLDTSGIDEEDESIRQGARHGMCDVDASKHCFVLVNHTEGLVLDRLIDAARRKIGL